MGIRNIFKNAIRLILVVLALSIPAYGKSAPQLPEPELSWKNVTVDDKKTAVFCIFKDSRGLVQIADYISTMGLLLILLVKMSCSGLKYILY